MKIMFTLQRKLLKARAFLNVENTFLFFKKALALSDNCRSVNQSLQRKCKNKVSNLDSFTMIHAQLVVADRPLLSLGVELCPSGGGGGWFVLFFFPSGWQCWDSNPRSRVYGLNVIPLCHRVSLTSSRAKSGSGLDGLTPSPGACIIKLSRPSYIIGSNKLEYLLLASISGFA